MMMSGDNLSEFPVISGRHRPRPRRPEQGQEGHSGGQRRHRNLSRHQQLQSAHQRVGHRRRRCAQGSRPKRSVPPADHALPRSLIRPIAASRSTFESIPDDDEPAYLSFIQALYAQMHPRNLRLYVNVAVATSDNDLKAIAANSDGIILMNYDEHQTTSDPGPIASQPWFVGNLRPRPQNRAQGKNHLRDRQLRLRLDALHPQSKRSQSASRRSSIPTISPYPMPGSAPPTPMPISISTTTHSILTSSTSTRTATSATWSGSSTPSPS